MANRKPLSDPDQIVTACRSLKRRDKLLGGVIEQIGQFSLRPRSGGYEMLVRSIISQQISTAAARTIRARLQGLLPGGRIQAASIEGLSDEQLQAVGISQQKRGYIRHLTECTRNGTVNFRRIALADDESAIAELVQVKGIGRWTAQMFLMFSLGRADIFAPDDLGLRNAIIRLYSLTGKPHRNQLLEIAEAWAPWRSVASWYLWRSLELPLISSASTEFSNPESES